MPFIALAQRNEKDNQWWVGLKAGVNTTKILPGDSYTALSFSDEESPGKNYAVKNGVGYQVGLLGTWDFLGSITLSFQPFYAHHTYNYETEYSWTSDENNLTIKNEHQNSLDYVYLPLFVRYEFKLPSLFGGGGSKPVDHGHNHQKNKRLYSSKTQKRGGASGSKAKTIPYIQVGYYYSRLIGAEKMVTQTETINGYEETPTQELIGTTDLTNKANHGLLFGGGISYDIGGSFRLALDVNYHMGLANLTNQKARYSNEKLAQQYYDVPDDVRMQNWDFSIHFIFPLKFVYSGSFKSI